MQHHGDFDTENTKDFLLWWCSMHTVSPFDVKHA